MLAILSIIIGLVFVLLLFSMLTSAVVEVYHAAMSSRGKHLQETIEIMLGKDICDKFYNHAYFRQLSSATKPRSSGLKLPVWLDKETFSSVLADVLTPSESKLSVPERIQLIENPNLRKVLDFLWRQANGDKKVFQHKVEMWFEEVMARAKDWFGDATKWRLFVMGLILAGILNADTLQIYKSLSANAALRDELVESAENFTATHESVPASPDTSKTFDQAKTDFQSTKQLYVETVASPLGLGWSSTTALPAGFWDWLTKVLGWVLTGIAVTLGAPFWFNLLKKLLTLKSGTSSDSSSSNSEANAPKAIPAFDMESARRDPSAEDSVG